MNRYVMKDYISSGLRAILLSVISLSSGHGNLHPGQQLNAGIGTMEDYQEELLEQSRSEPEDFDPVEDATEL
jgi:hypothetical protein